MKQIRFTQEGYNTLEKEYAALLAMRKGAVEDLRKAREMGDLSENGYYKAARGKLSSIDRNLRRLSLSLKQAVVVTSTNKNTATIGNTVLLRDGEKEVTYQIVGDLESNPTLGKISLLSPIGRAIAGKQVGDRVVVVMPVGVMEYTIRKIF